MAKMLVVILTIMVVMSTFAHVKSEVYYGSERSNHHNFPSSLDNSMSKVDLKKLLRDIKYWIFLYSWRLKRQDKPISFDSPKYYQQDFGDNFEIDDSSERNPANLQEDYKRSFVFNPFLRGFDKKKFIPIVQEEANSNYLNQNNDEKRHKKLPLRQPFNIFYRGMRIFPGHPNNQHVDSKSQAFNIQGTHNLDSKFKKTGHQLVTRRTSSFIQPPHSRDLRAAVFNPFYRGVFPHTKRTGSRSSDRGMPHAFFNVFYRGMRIPSQPQINEDRFDGDTADQAMEQNIRRDSENNVI